MYYNARWYDPLLSRFSSADTIIPQPGNPLDWDRFAYVKNNPIIYSDPSGHKGCNNWDENGKCVVDEDWKVKPIRKKLSQSLTAKSINPTKFVETTFQLLPVSEPYYYNISAEETYTGFSGSGGATFPGAVVGIANDFLIGFRPTYYKLVTPYDQILTIFYQESYLGVPRLDALKTTTVTDITITNNSSLNRVVVILRLIYLQMRVCLLSHLMQYLEKLFH